MRPSRLKILVADDESSVRRNIEKVLVKEGYIVATANDGEQALRELERCSFDLIVLDVIMPDWTGMLSKRVGVDVLKKIRSKNLSTPVVLPSANDNIELVAESTRYGPIKYLVKGSVSDKEFLKTIQDSIVESSQTRNSLNGSNIKKIKGWLIDRSSGILDEIIAGLIVAGMMYILGIVSGELKGEPLDWLVNNRNYLIVSGIVIAAAIILYVVLQKNRVSALIFDSELKYPFGEKDVTQKKC